MPPNTVKDSHIHLCFSFEPIRSDYFLRILCRLFAHNPFLLTIIYSVISLGGTVLFAHLAGSAVPVINDHVELFEDYSNIINFGIVLPAGIWLALHFYSRVREGFLQIIRDNVVQFKHPSTRQRFLSRLDTSINRRSFFWASLLLAVVFNTVFLLRKQNAWNDIYGGVPTWWFRVFAVITFQILIHISFKAFVVVYSIRQLFTNRINLQPLHPDGCGGLRSLGNISLALNYVICLVAMYISVLAFVERTPLEHPLFPVIVLLFVAIAMYMFFAPLAKAHDIMARQKRLVLSALNREFQTTYTQVAAGLNNHGIALQDAQKIEALERLYRIASRMPVWPIDTKIVTQFMAVVALPMIVALIVELIKHWLT